MTRRSKRPDWDDGRTIANMNVEGMPWYQPEKPDAAPPSPNVVRQEMSREEIGMFTLGALKAALIVVGVMCAAIVLFVLFCLYVWFK
jgi:hypothetical protein